MLSHTACVREAKTNQERAELKNHRRWFQHLRGTAGDGGTTTPAVADLDVSFDDWTASIVNRTGPENIIIKSVWGRAGLPTHQHPLNRDAGSSHGLAHRHRQLTPPTPPTRAGLGPPACGLRELEIGVPLRGGSWQPRGSAATYTPYCPYLRDKTRYNCVEKNTTANDFRFEFGSEECAVRSIADSLPRLAGEHLHLCGDSHMRQVFLEILCSDARQVKRYNGAAPPDPAGRWGPPGGCAEQTTGLNHYYPANFFGGEHAVPDGPCRLQKHFAHSNHRLYIAELAGNVTISLSFLRTGSPDDIRNATHKASEPTRY